ncbi:capsular biosynthesis protein [Vogesella sp. LYT5W]|uniref:Capsular biosynthesis protein n=1 Tax=Vogesella margarita TaxID=2984199 RepID=A0ABT5INC4_9NEIS|nr:capsular biosynthesis protein [Vogesella margarita]MDC7713703.1 capsular biosynthesis protein [Vogesella margarita]
MLLLQGPMGFFFYRFACWLRAQGVRVLKVNFNGGDNLFYRDEDVFNYRGRLEDFPLWLGRLLHEQQVDAMVCFGDCRTYHRHAAAVAKEKGKGFFAFEEGYLRPDYITLEEDGVNAHSPLWQDTPAQLAAHPVREPEKPLPTGNSFWKMAISAMAYYAAASLARPWFPHYRHHRDFSVLREGLVWIRSGYRKHLYRWRDRHQQDFLVEKLDQRYFLQVLQVHNDSQVHHHSDFDDVSHFIRHVMDSFARHAASDMHLVIKHHPLDRGYHHYGKLISSIAASTGLSGRVHYLHDVHLPTLIKHACGLVTINSTVGLQALYHGKPCIVLGRALYDLTGLTHQSGLQHFWRNPEPVSRELYLRFRATLIEKTQLNGAFYGRSHWMTAGMSQLRQLKVVNPQAGERAPLAGLSAKRPRKRAKRASIH